jgi:hypothetical protein
MSIKITASVAPGGALVTLRVGVTPVHLTASEVELLISSLRECRAAMLPRPAPDAPCPESNALPDSATHQ